MIDGHPGLRPLDISVVAFLASNGSSSCAQLMDAVWNGELVELTTLWNRLGKVRAQLGDFIPPRVQQADEVRLAPGVMTDLQVLAALVERASTTSSIEAIGLLAQGLSLVRGTPFDHPVFEWAHLRQHVAKAEAVIERAALRLCDLALEAHDLDLARTALTDGLRALQLNEPLYRARMNIEARVGNIAAVRRVYAELRAGLGKLDGEPHGEASAQTRALFEQLTAAAA